MLYKSFAIIFSAVILSTAAHAGPANTNSARGLKSSSIVTAPQYMSNDLSYDRVENATHLMNRGMENYREGDFKTAVMTLRRILRENPHHARANFYMGLSKQKLGQHRQAIKYLEITKRYVSSVPQIHVALSQSLLAEGKTRQAEELLLDIEALAVSCANACSQSDDIETAQKIMRSNLGL